LQLVPGMKPGVPKMCHTLKAKYELLKDFKV